MLYPQGSCVYLLHGTRYYLGSTNNLERRVHEHIKGEYSTKRIGLWKLVGYLPCSDLKTARQIEKRIKKLGHYETNLLKYGMISMQ